MMPSGSVSYTCLPIGPEPSQMGVTLGTGAGHPCGRRTKEERHTLLSLLAQELTLKPPEEGTVS